MTPLSSRPPPPVGAAEPAAPVRPTRPTTGRTGEPGGAFSVAKDLLHPTHYERLGVPADADDVTLSEAYRQAAADDTDAASAGAPAPWPHPGVPENAATRQRQLQLAYQVLQDRERRAVYDRWLAQEQQRLQASALRRWPRGWRWALGGVLLLGLLLVGLLR